MKLKDIFITQQMGDKQIMVSAENSVFAGLARSNRTAAFIVDCLKKETTRDGIVDAMFEKYDAPREVLARDVDAILAKLRSIGALDE